MQVGVCIGVRTGHDVVRLDQDVGVLAVRVAPWQPSALAAPIAVVPVNALLGLAGLGDSAVPVARQAPASVSGRHGLALLSFGDCLGKERTQPFDVEAARVVVNEALSVVALLDARPPGTVPGV